MFYQRGGSHYKIIVFISPGDNEGREEKEETQRGAVGGASAGWKRGWANCKRVKRPSPLNAGTLASGAGL